MRKSLRGWFTEHDTKDNLLLAARAKAKQISGITKEEYLAAYQKMWEDATLTEKA